MRQLISILLFIIYSICFGQTEKIESLLVAEFVKNDVMVGNTTHLVKYNFSNGALTSKDTIFSNGPHKNVVVYGDKSILYKNRYLIASSGAIIDIQKSELLLNGYNRFIDTIGNSIIFSTGNVNIKGYQIFDLDFRTYELKNDSNLYSPSGIYSPNYKWVIEVEPGQTILKDTYTKKIVKVFTRGTYLSMFSSQRSCVPVLWIDNENILFANISNSGIVEIMNFNIVSKKEALVVTIDSVPTGLVNASFYFNPENKIIFQCAKGLIEIDLDKNTCFQNEFSSIGNNFEIEYEHQNSYGRVIKCAGKEIGRFWCNYKSARTTDGHIAIEYGDTGSNLGYPKGIKIWNNINKTWLDVELPWIDTIISWTE